jgi:hypothetical protein
MSPRPQASAPVGIGAGTEWSNLRERMPISL